MRTANELSAVHSRDLPIRAMDLFPIAIACETGADEFLTFDEDQANLARAAASPFGKAKMPSTPETSPARQLPLLLIVIPARDEEGYGFIDSTWQILQSEASKILIKLID